jgi:hypothetical protein
LAIVDASLSFLIKTEDECPHPSVGAGFFYCHMPNGLSDFKDDLKEVKTAAEESKLG